MKRKVLFIFALLCAVAQGAWAQRVVNLSTWTRDYEAHDGDVLTGNLASPFKVIIDDNATVTLSGVSIKPQHLTDNITSCIKCLGNATIILAEGTTNEIYPCNCPGIWVGPEGTTTTIKGTGSIKVKVLWGCCPGIGGDENCGNIVIENGIIEAEGYWTHDDAGNNYGGPGIGASPNFSCGDITIKGGKITAYGGRYGAGIGKGSEVFRETKCGTIKILGGEVNAFGGRCAAGIGGGLFTDGCVTLIDGGVVYAYGGDDGAGIGGGANSSLYGYGGNGGNITIKKGTIVAKGGTDAAGIGGGEGGTGGNIFIYGGDITAIGGDYGAGIGGGNGARGGAIWITGGTVKAYGGTDAAGIGGGEDGGSGSIVINDGNVFASGDGYGVGIGAGEDGDVDNTISINGGIVDAYGGLDISRAIGGEDPEDYTPISIGQGMSITNVSEEKLLQYHLRGYFLSSYIRLKFEPCDHAGQTLSYAYLNDEKHRFYCKWCGIMDEAHTGLNECTKCTYNETSHSVNYYEMVYNEGSQKYEYQLVATETFKNSLVLPAHKGTVPADRVFVGWVGGEPDANDDGSLKNETLYSPGTYLNSGSEEVNYKARYVNKTLELATVQSDQKLYDGMTVTGTLNTASYPVKVTIADGATVTLSNVDISGVNNENYNWAGITCEGNATIILADGTTNIVKGFYEDYPGIFVPASSILTIDGEGSLNASSNGFGAGIGGGYNGASCGVISINGGNITATGGTYAAGIGSSHRNSCSHIIISGGTIHATGGESAAGIGSGWGCTNEGDFSSCGMISITNGVTSVTATKGSEDAPNSIGAGTGNSTCGSVAIGNMVGVVTRSPYNYVPLPDEADNSTKISAFENNPSDVTLYRRTLYKDGAWNTLCLPFSLNSFAGTPLEGATVKTLTSTSFSDGTLTMNFTDDVSSIEAGKPYIVKWASGDNIESPTFTNVTISTTTPTDITPTGEGSDGSVTFKGTFGPVAIGTDGDNTKLYLGNGNKLYWPSREMSINSFRAYFQLNNGITAGNQPNSGVRAFVLNFDGNEQTGITTTNYTDSTHSDNAWYDLSGRQLSGKPAKKGVYIHRGKKQVVK